MSKAKKAAMMSAFLFPGSGFFVIKQKAMGVVVVAISIMNLSVIGSIFMATIEHRMSQLMMSLNSLSGNMPVSVTAPLPSSDSHTLLFCGIVLTIAYAFSIYDCYRRGHLLDQIEQIRREKDAEKDQYHH